MIFAAGLGTRLKPLTDSKPKALVEIDGKPLLEHVITKLTAAGFDEIIVNVHHFAGQIIDFIRQKNNFGVRLEISDERQMLLDTGGGIQKAAWFFDDEPFLVHNVDILSDIDLQSLYKNHLETGAEATLAVSSRTTLRYLFFDPAMRMRGWINEATGEVKPAGTVINPDWQKLAFSGIHVISPSLLAKMNAGKFSIIDFYLSCVNDSYLAGFHQENARIIDVGKLQSIKEAEEFMRN